jgi:hypothetical protein
MKMKSIEKLIMALRRYDFTLQLHSTNVGSLALYTACFWHIDDGCCPECAGHVPNHWHIYKPADTVKEAIVLAAQACIKEAGLENEMKGLI